MDSSGTAIHRCRENILERSLKKATMNQWARVQSSVSQPIIQPRKPSTRRTKQCLWKLKAWPNHAFLTMIMKVWMGQPLRWCTNLSRRHLLRSYRYCRRTFTWGRLSIYRRSHRPSTMLINSSIRDKKTYYSTLCSLLTMWPRSRTMMTICCCRARLLKAQMRDTFAS